ncbi:UDP-N-acetylmuramoyl-L-alanine--D-glutamate ligase [filamentous cyanobacterium LEGE 11480]|uniref:UDP-N-acetylmuramoylalanine--D-glutamate ligase n=1 Tax=Romeriopsis navalis LEGE 11480 TaxID=2777977 RepID=A0A928VIT4_9CYAN|nr:UDP-N-acetylmuramoyl-L-alanine--D-glutamate ligase [Romeriopsis navalis]MBE9029115.1 UDP-N-acetylmuramoyl-L-alanine--D-glutamate ligase [Romeriopsis navalis LEGE 11480]
MAHAYVIGLGKSGNAAARLLKQQGWSVTISDRGNSDALQHQSQALVAEGIAVKLGDDFDPAASQPELLVVSPGVPWDVPSLEQARRLGVATIGDMELAWRHLIDRPWVAITGTNGKTTCTALTAAIFQAAGFQAPAFGNIGFAACEVAMATPQPDWCIAELSSYQIEAAASITPKIALWTTFTPDHLARHKTMPNYFDMKARLLARAEQQIFNGDDANLRAVGLNGGFPVRRNACWTSISGKEQLIGDPDRGAYIQDDWIYVCNQKIMAASTLKMPGDHNRQNLLMAVAAAYFAGVPNEKIELAIAAFPGVAHRLELIRTWNGIEFINDSKATNYDAAEVGLSSMQGSTILIAGGAGKAGDDEAWMASIKAKAAAVLLIGDAAPDFARRLKAIGYEQYELLDTMANAVPRAAELAQQKNAGYVLLSPACASFDQYANFEQRGDDFRQLCEAVLV